MSMKIWFFAKLSVICRHSTGSKEKLQKDLQKGWRTIDHDHFKRLKDSLALWKGNIKK